MKNQSPSYLDYFIQFFIIAALTLVPVFFTSIITNAFTIEKHAIFRFCVLSLLALFAIRLVYQPQKYNLPKIFWLIPIFWVIALLSTYFGISPTISTWGIHLRMDGLITMTFLVAFFVVVYLFTDNLVKLRQIIWSMVIASVIPIGYALAQKLSLDQISWKGVDSSERVFGTTGNPAYLGAYLLFIIPLTVYLAITQKNILRYIFIILSLLQIIVLVFTGARAAYIGLITEIFIFSATYFYLLGKKNITQIIAIIFILATVLIGLININPGLSKSFTGNYYLNRLANLAEYESGTGRDRLQMWKIATQAIATRPIIGSGIMSYAYYFNLHYPNYMDARPEKDRFSNYPHNLLLDTATSHGIVGLMVLLSAFFLSIYLAFRKIFSVKNISHQLILLAFVTALCGYLVQAQFNLETIITWVYWYSFLALTVGATYQMDQPALILPSRVSAIKQVSVTLWVIACIVGINYLVIGPVRADQNYLLVDAATDLSLDKKIALALESQTFTPYYEYSHVKVSDLYTGQLNSKNMSEVNATYEKIIAELQTAIKISPYNYKNLYSLGLIYGNWAKVDKSKLTEAENYFAKAAAMSPNRLDIHWGWANVYLENGDLEKAKQQIQIAQKLNPEIGETYYHLAKIDYIQKNNSATQADLAKAKQLGYSFDEKQFYAMFTTTKSNS